MSKPARRVPHTPPRQPGGSGSPEPLRVLLVVAQPPHGASDRVRLTDLIVPLGASGIEVRPWTQPALAALPTGTPAASTGGGPSSVDDLGALLWADVIWVRRFVGPIATDAGAGEAGPSGFDALLSAVAEDPGLLHGRRLVYDFDADLLDPRVGTRAAAARAARSQVDRLLSFADIVTVSTSALGSSLRGRVPGERLRVLPVSIPVQAYEGAVREPGRVPVVAIIDALDGPGGMEAWLPQVAALRRADVPFRLVRIADPAAPVVDGFDEVHFVDEGTSEWVETLVRIAPDIALAPSLGDRFAERSSALTWLEATAVGAATIAGRGSRGPYADLVDGVHARLVDGAEGASAALVDLLASEDRRRSLASGALDRVRANLDTRLLAADWAAAFRAAATIAPRSGVSQAPALVARRAERRRGIAREIARPPRAPNRPAVSLALIGAIPPDPSTLFAAFDAACRLSPAPAEIVLAGDAAAVSAAQRLAHGAPRPVPSLRLVTVPSGADAGETIAAALTATTAAWVGMLDASAELRPDGIAALIRAIQDNDLDAAFGELVVAGPAGDVERVGGWPPAPHTFRAPTLVVAGDVARGAVTPAHAELDDPVLDWLLALMASGVRAGSAGVVVARALPVAARATRIRSVGLGVPYADGGEDRLLGVIASAEDRSATSDELARSIRDWVTRYHLSRLRGNIVESVAFPPAARVVDVGAGTGTIARSLGERGLTVTALEGTFDRARVAAVRCADLPNVEVIHGTVGDYQDRGTFDAAVIIGVLEYSGSFQGGAAGPAAFLGQVRSLLRPDGVIILAIENRFGLKYLQGYAEDHVGRPWVGIDGYATSGGIRTWSRRALRGLLVEAGFPCQRWRYPFPDYKLPTLVLDETAYQEPDAVTLIDGLVRQPVRDMANPRTLQRDDRAAHQGFLEAGLGEDVANSFLVIAGSSEPELERYAPSDGPLAWLYGDERASRWLRRRTVDREDGGRVVVMKGEPGSVVAGDLLQVRPGREAFVTGATLEQELKDVLAADGVAGATPLLRAWVAAIDAERDQWSSGTAAQPRPRRATAAGPAAGPATPFGPLHARDALPGSMIDLIPANFIRSPGGRLTRIDREWQVASVVDRNIALLRGLWYFTGMIINGSWPCPWPPGTPIRQMVDALAEAAGIAHDDALFERFRLAEFWLQTRVQLGSEAPG